MIRRAIIIPLVLASLAAAASAHAQTPDPQAEALNAEGKTLYSETKDYAGAVAKFRAAIAIQRDARYYYNLCSALDKMGDYRAALDACDEVFGLSPREDLATKTGQRAAQIRKAWREQQLAQQPPPTQPTDAPPPAVDPVPTPTPAETQAVAAATITQHRYQVALGADLGGVRNAGVGDRNYARGGFQLKLHGDLILAPKLDIGAQAYIHLGIFGERAEVAVSHALSIFDFGAAGYWHRRLWRSLYVTPLVGFHFSGISTGSEGGGTDTYGTVGLRLEGSLAWVLDAAGRHVVQVTPVSLNIYAGSRADTATLYGLDGGGATWAFTVGYTLRFARGPFKGLSLE